MKKKDWLFVLLSIAFILFFWWFAVSEFGKSLDGFKPVAEETEEELEIYTVRGSWENGALVLERGNE